MNRDHLRQARKLLGRARERGQAHWGEWIRCVMSDPRWANSIPSRCTKAFKNRAYVVQFYPVDGGPGMDHLMIVPNDGAPSRSWPDLQAIKDQLCGKEREAVEIYPPASEVVDDFNVYHLWVLPKGGRIGFGIINHSFCPAAPAGSEGT